MTVFWAVVGLLVTVALGFVLVPLVVKRSSASSVSADELNLSVFQQQVEELDADLAAGNLDQQQYRAARADLERELLSDIPADATSPVATRSGRWAIPLLAVALPVVSLGIYQLVGSHDIIPRLAQQSRPRAEAPNPHSGDRSQMPPLDVLVEKLAQRLENEPDNIQGWLMLGRSYLALGNPAAAAKALEHALKLDANNAGILLALAEAYADAAGNNLSGRPAVLIGRALEIDPQNPNALWMMGLVSFQRNDFESALEHWQRAQAQMQPNSRDAATIAQYIEQARARLGTGEQTLLAATASPQPAVTPEPAAQSSASIQVTVDIAPTLKEQVNGTDRVFIFARAVTGPPMPLAATTATVADLPLTVRLDDSMAMMPQFALSKFNEVVVGARVSKSGNALPQPGDLEGEVSPVKPGGDNPVEVLIDNIHR